MREESRIINGLAVWNGMLTAVLKLPKVRVDRRKFLRNNLKPYCRTTAELEQAISNPIATLPEAVIDRVARSCIRNVRNEATVVSFGSGFLGPFGIAPDFAESLRLCIVLSQKLAYLYGWPDMLDENRQLTETTRDMLSIFIGVMLNVSKAGNMLSKLARNVAASVGKCVAKETFSRTSWYPLLRTICAALGLKMTRNNMGNVVVKAVPIAASTVSGALTWWTFTVAANRLQKKLKEEMHVIHAQLDDEDIENIVGGMADE